MGPVEIPTLITEMSTEIPTETQSTFQRPPKCTPGGREYISEIPTEIPTEIRNVLDMSN